MKVFVGIDTSAYTTSVAVVDQGSRVLKSVRRLLQVAPGERGLRQSEAVFAHVRQLPSALQEALEGINPGDIAALCASDRPVDREDSYMPVFQVGSGLAASVAATLKVPCYYATHQQGHLAAALIGMPPFAGKFLALHLSGGTTDLLLVTENEVIIPLARSRDLHAGQLVDRIGVVLGLPFPAGPALEGLAVRGKASGRYPVAVEGMDIHLSGAEAQALRDLEAQALKPQDVAAEVFDLLCRSTLRMLAAAAEQHGCGDVLVFGGVASASLLRENMQRRVEARRLPLRLRFGKQQYSGDNAAGIAMIGARRYSEKKQEVQHG